MSDVPAPAPLQLFALPPIWGAPSPSPFAIKLQTWLRMAGIPYATPPMTGPPASASGKIPYVRMPDGRILYDSGLIIATLSAERGVDLDAGLDPAGRARAHAIRRMLEEHLYFAGAWERWVDTGAARTAVDYFRHLPWGLRQLAPLIAGRGIRRNLHGQGMGRHRAEDIRAAGIADIDALATLLGEGPFVLGAPSTVDATALGVLWALSANPFPSVFRDAVLARPNLVAYTARMRGRYWSDWTG